VSGVVWEAPSPRGGKGPPRKWDKRLLPLRERPGEWARVWESTPASARQAVVQLRRGQVGSGVNASQFEFSTRTIDGRGVLYARFIGDVS
jgi:hypothetical protein